MCAIAGLISLEAEQHTLEAMLKTMASRGPDGAGSYQDTVCTLLHSRLAIIDPAGGKQPMELYFGGEHYILVYNGELYNTSELRRELEHLGHHFEGHSDTEVLLHAYAQWGRECLHMLNGIFSFAVWEKGNNRLFLARDRIGVKPLFYAQPEGGLIFASEIKTILCHPSVKSKLDDNNAAEIVMLGPGRLPGSGVFHGIRELEKRPESGLLAGLWQFPNIPGRLDAPAALGWAAERGLKPTDIRRIAEKKHIFTHIQWRMTGIYLEVSEKPEHFRWFTEEEIEKNAALPTAFRQFWEERDYV